MAQAKPETSDDDKIVITKDGKLNPGGSAGMLSLKSLHCQRSKREQHRFLHGKGFKTYVMLSFDFSMLSF